MTWQSQAIALLAASLGRPFVLAAAAWLILRVFRVRHPASRHAVWTAVLIGMLLLPFVSVITPHWKLPVLPWKQEIAVHSVAPVRTVFTASARPDSITYEAQEKNPAHVLAWPSFETLIVWCYLAGFFVMVTYRAVGWALLWRVMSRSRRLRGRTLRESGDVLTPVAVGVLRPVVILPTGWRDWDANTKRAVLAHEFAHLRRHDALVSALSWWVKCLFWFHPLAWWISRKVSDLAELACDAAALEKVGDPGEYSRMLLGFAEAVNRAGHRAALPGLAMAAGSGIDRRIDLIFELSGGNMRKLARPGILLAVLGVPVICLAATVGLGENGDRSRLPSTAPVAATTNAPAILAQPQPPAADTPLAKTPNPEPRRLISPPIVAQNTAAPRSPAQSAPAAMPRFDAASIKVSKNPAPGGDVNITPGRFRGKDLALQWLILVAYRINSGNLSGNLPNWTLSERYDINAETADASGEGRILLALQTLLQDRFGLRLHREIKEEPVYFLTVGKNGLKMPPGSCVPVKKDLPNECYSSKRVGLVQTLDWRGVRMSDPDGVAYRTLAGYFSVSGIDRRPVIDKTGLTGTFDVHLRWSQNPESAAVGSPGNTVAPVPLAEPGAPSIFDAMEEQLGLKLESGRGPVEYLVVDHAEKPSEN